MNFTFLRGYTIINIHYRSAFDRALKPETLN